MIVEEYFDECPYSGRICHNGFDCADCAIEIEERLWAEDKEEDEDDE